MRRSLTHVSLALLALAGAVPAGAEVFFVTLNNGTTFESAYQPQAASWDTGMVLLLTETGNWIGLPQADIKEVRSETQIAGYGRAIDDNTFELGFAPNDASDPDAKPAAPAEERAQMLEQMLMQQQQELDQRTAQESYTVDQFVEPGELQGIPTRFIGEPTGPALVNPNQNQ
jgi:hypothetical protein